jgi:hypothetical protein
MVIEVLTAKKKLSKSLIAQMPHPSVGIIQNAEVLGYVMLETKVAILHYRGEYYAIRLSWQREGAVIKSTHGKRVMYVKRVWTQEERDMWWDAYTTMLGKALQTHIYI